MHQGLILLGAMAGGDCYRAPVFSISLAPLYALCQAILAAFRPPYTSLSATYTCPSESRERSAHCRYPFLTAIWIGGGLAIGPAYLAVAAQLPCM